MNRFGALAKFFAGLGLLLRSIPARVTNFFRVRPGTSAVPRSNREIQILVGEIGLVACGLVALVFIVFSLGIFGGGSTPVTIVVPSTSPGASNVVVANNCDTAPVATPTPGPSASPQVSAGNPCDYLSGIVVVYNSATDPTLAQPLGGQSLSAVLTNVDGGGRLPADSLRNTVSGGDGTFSLPIYTGGSWRVYYSRPVNGGVQSFPITVVSVLDHPPGTPFGPDWAPACDAGGSTNQDASFHFAGDTRLVMAISVCPAAILASVVSIEIPRIPFVVASAPPAYNPVSITLNFASRLRYTVAVAQTERIAQVQSGSSGSLTLPLLLLLGTILCGSLAYWIKVRMRDIDKMPEARLEDDQ